MATVLAVLASPVEAMDGLARQPRFAAALLLMTFVSIAATLVAWQRGVVDHALRQRIAASSQIERLPASQRAEILEQGARVGSYYALASSLFNPAIIVLILSGLFLLLAHLAGTSPGFRPMMAVVTHSWLPMSLNALIGIPIMLAKEPEAIDLQNLVTMANLSPLFSAAEQPKLYRLASSIDLFSVWAITLLTIGLTRLTGKSRRYAVAMVLAPWALYVIVYKVLAG